MVTARTVVFVTVTLALGACSGGDDGASPAPGAGGGAAGTAPGGAGVSGTSLAGAAGSSSAGTVNASGTAGSGGASATAGSGGSAGSGGAAPGPVLPVMRDGVWAFDFGDVTLEVDPQIGGRITTFKLGNENLLTGPTVNPTYWGSTLWTSPESQWAHPPPGPIDSDPYAAEAKGPALVLTGQPYAMLGVSVTKTFSVDTTLGAFKIEYKLNNTKQTAIQMAPWEVTRVLPRGLTFFPTGSKLSLSANATLPTTNSDGVTWFAYDMAAVTNDSKLYADAAEGWVAHVAQGLVFIKSFADVPIGEIAPQEGDVELYTNKLHTYIEIENQAAYGDIAPGGNVAWTVNWFLRKLPAGVDGAAPNAALAKLVRDTIAGQ